MSAADAPPPPAASAPPAPAADPVLEQRRPKGKKRRRTDINTNHLELYAELAPRRLRGLLIDGAVWLPVDDATCAILDALCLGNLDGGRGTAALARAALAAAGAEQPPGEKAVRLSLDEAVFLAHALGLLTVHAGDARFAASAPPSLAAAGDNAADLAAADPAAAAAAAEAAGAAAAAPPPELSVDALWRAASAVRPDFLPLYLCYHHFRAKGWIARTGLQYGADMVLYQRHPALAHSDYSVLILAAAPPAPGGGGRGGPGDADGAAADGWAAAGAVRRPRPEWRDVQVLNRLTTQVGKRLLLLFVQELDGGEAGESAYDSPACLDRFAVHERLVRRWVPESQVSRM
jgi:hypothetical protein